MLPAVIDENKIDHIVNEVVTKNDFAVIEGNIEIKRDLALKLFAFSNLSYDTQVLSTTVVSSEETVYIVKAKVYKDEGGKVSEGLGACSTTEIKGHRKHHDALAIAETRAFKRALEACVGLPFINQIILKVFGTYQKQSEKVSQTKTISPEEVMQKLITVNDLQHLKNVWEKYKVNLKSYSQDDRVKVTAVKDARKVELSSSNGRRNEPF